MASTPSELAAIPAPPATDSATPPANLLVALTPLAPEAIEATLANLALAFPTQTVAISGAVPESAAAYPNLQFLNASQPAQTSAAGWVLTAADFLNLYTAAKDSAPAALLLLGPEAQSLSPDAIRALAAAVTNGADLAVPHYDLGPREGLVNSALLYPVSRAIFGGRPRFPLAVDLGLSLRMATRLGTVAQKFTATNQNDALIWPVAEAAVAGFSIAEVPVGARTLPQPATSDLNSLLAHIAGSLFAEVETCAAFWQRTRVSPAAAWPASRPFASDEFPDVEPMLDAFQLAYRNLHEIWSLVLPPNSLLALKRLSQMSPASFRMGDSLWARTVYDFILAYRLRTINRGHLLGALTPLYLAWVASHILLARAGTDPERHIEEAALAFETDKAYFVSRWRWPDRFNP
jgi:hypothetical protein